jgi:hypothetical protein
MPKITEPNHDQKQIIEEIINLVSAFRREIPPGRSAWPQSIRDRVQFLHSSGMSYRQISVLTGLPYDTVVAWPGRRSAGFQALQVIDNRNVATAAVATLPSHGLSFQYKAVRIEGLNFSQIEALLLKFVIEP